MRKKLLLVCLIAVSVTSMAFSAGGSEGTGADEAGVDEPVTLVIHHWDSTEIVRNQIEAFEAVHPNIDVELVLTARNDYPDRLRVSLSGGDRVDIYATANTGEYEKFTSTFGAVNLEPLANESGMRLDNYGAMLNILEIDGELRGLPSQRDAWLLFYNKDHFDELGVDYPRDGMSWEEYEELALQVTTEETYGSFMQDWAQIWYAPQIQAGGTIFDDDLSAMMDGLAMHGRMQNEDESEMHWAEVRSGRIHHRDAFAQGRVAMMFIGPWMISILNDFIEDGTVGFEYDVAIPPQPRGAVMNSTLGGPGAMLSINPRTRHVDAAWKLVEFLTGPEGSLMRALDGQPPAFVNDEIIDAFVGDDPQPDNLGLFLQLNPLVARPPLPGVADIHSVIGEEGELYLVGVQSLEETEENIRSRRQEVLDSL